MRGAPSTPWSTAARGAELAAGRCRTRGAPSTPWSMAPSSPAASSMRGMTCVLPPGQNRRSRIAITGRSIGRRDSCPRRHCPHPRTGRSSRHDFRLWDPIDYIFLNTLVSRAAAELSSRIRVIDQQVKVETRHHSNLFHGIRD